MSEIDPKRLQAWKELLVGKSHADVELSDGQPTVVGRQYVDQRTISAQNFLAVAQTVFPDTTWRTPQRAQSRRNGNFIEQLQAPPTEPTLYHFSYPGRPEESQSTYLLVLPEDITLTQEPTPRELSRSAQQKLRDLGLNDDAIKAVVEAAGPALAVEAVLVAQALRQKLYTRPRVMQALHRALGQEAARSKRRFLRSLLAEPSAESATDINNVLRSAVAFVGKGW